MIKEKSQIEIELSKYKKRYYNFIQSKQFSDFFSNQKK